MKRMVILGIVILLFFFNLFIISFSFNTAQGVHGSNERTGEMWWSQEKESPAQEKEEGTIVNIQVSDILKIGYECKQRGYTFTECQAVMAAIIVKLQIAEKVAELEEE